MYFGLKRVKNVFLADTVSERGLAELNGNFQHVIMLRQNSGIGNGTWE
jgi:hypothetical protein